MKADLAYLLFAFVFRKISVPTCGSDGVTYKSVCHLQLASCKANKPITVMYDGKCGNLNSINIYSSALIFNSFKSEEPCKFLKCDSSKIDPVCGTDNNTYTNECFMTLKSCNTKNNIHVKHRGGCIDHNLIRVVNSCDQCKFNGDCSMYAPNKTMLCSCAKFDCSNHKQYGDF